MLLVMCLACGEFALATVNDERVVPVSDHCPDCGSREFKHRPTDTVVRTDE